MPSQYKKLYRELVERVKELECLYGFSKLMEKRDRPLPEIFQKAVNLFPRSWQYSEIACAKIVIEGREYLTRDFKQCPWRQAAPIKAFGKKIGLVEVGYSEKRPPSFEGPFLKEERALLDAMAGRLGNLFELKTLDKNLEHAEVLLKRQNKILAQKNMVLREMLSQVEVEKANIQHNVMVNLNQSVMPLLERLKTVRDPARYISLIKEQLNAITSTFGVKMTAAHLRMTPRELEICNLIKGNLSTKQISTLLNLSDQTVDHHRKSIRKKLGVSNKDINLATYLQFLSR